MFQFAFGNAISINTGQQVNYCIDTIPSYDSARIFDLENAFHIVVPRATPEDVSNILRAWRSLPSMRRILSRLNNNFLSGPNFLTDKNFYPSSKLTSKIQKSAYFHGYWQSEDFFISHENIIRNLFQFRGELSSENQEIITRIKLGQSIAMHIRRGDYVTNPKANAMHGVLNADYYFSALASLRRRVPNARLFVFTDDPNWVQTEVVGKMENSECVNINSGGNSFRDMQLMSICEHNIVANSSFSWWSAWLNPNPKKIVIAPKKWFYDESISDKSLIPASWERM